MAQIQTKFWGLGLGEYQPSLETAKRIISERCDFAYIDGSSLVANGGYLGGYDWAYIRFDFHKEKYYGLYNVSFANRFDNYNDALVRYDSLMRSLTQKYGEPFPLESEDGGTAQCWSDHDNRCMLILNKTGFIALTYYNADLSELATKKKEDEL